MTRKSPDGHCQFFTLQFTLCEKNKTGDNNGSDKPGHSSGSLVTSSTGSSTIIGCASLLSPPPLNDCLLSLSSSPVAETIDDADNCDRRCFSSSTRLTISAIVSLSTGRNTCLRQSCISIKSQPNNTVVPIQNTVKKGFGGNVKMCFG